MGIKTIFASTYGPSAPPFFFWYPKGTSASEKKLLFKIDFFILTFGCLAYFTKWLDQANLSNAYVSGMKEDLGMYGTEYNLALTCFQVGTILGGIPSNLLLTWVRPRYLLPGCELLWAILTVATYKVSSYNQVSFSALCSRLYKNINLILRVSAVSFALLHWLSGGILIRWNTIYSRVLVQKERTRQAYGHIQLCGICWHHGLWVPPIGNTGRPGSDKRNCSLEMGLQYV